MAKNNAETRFQSGVRPILFLDIDGVLLRRRQPGVFDAFDLAPGCLEFLEWATARFRCFWLTSRARIGWPDGIRRAFRAAGAVLDEPRWAILDLIESAPWTATQMRSDRPEIRLLMDRRRRRMIEVGFCEDRLIEISTDTHPDALPQLIRFWNYRVEKSRRE